eukprot:CAMPEP_0184980856 /NCGR_PEP_ID=MMETSP1098-20130426/10737_1 /TAXON_ID=89044 /ORGANISM="Spumella elongata, Strain CCAP 955/1" /LENGTH=284 /DNA_ID=CAMNT_0027504345 /DNA_START=47 /DNA_END=897 /DNA_ORIENTATION=+
MSTSSNDEYIESLSTEILSWCECLVEKEKYDFKQSECNQRFMIVTEAKVTKACEHLCAKNKLQVDPSSRRIIVYKISPDVISEAREKIAEKNAAAEAAVILKKPVPKAVAAPASEANVLKPVAESKKTKAVDMVASVAKKQKTIDTTGVKKISTYFAVQPKTAKQSSVVTSHSDENTQPSAKSANSSVSSHASQHPAQHPSQHPSKPKQSALPPSHHQHKAPAPKLLLAVPKPMFVVDDYSPFKPQPLDEPFSPCEDGICAANEELVNFVCQLIATESDRHDTL